MTTGGGQSGEHTSSVLSWDHFSTPRWPPLSRRIHDIRITSKTFNSSLRAAFASVVVEPLDDWEMALLCGDVHSVIL